MTDIFDDQEVNAVVQTVIDSLPTLYYLVDAQGRIARWNRKSVEVSGYSDEEHKRLNVLDLFESPEREHIAARMEDVFVAGEAEAEAHLLTKNGQRIPYHFNGKRIHVRGRAYLSGLGTDISERKLLEEKLLLQATTDYLTGAMNRRHFLHHAEQDIARAKRYDSPLSLLMLDLDNFKSINDHFGHQGGDIALKTLIAICRGVVRDVDSIGRLGGEEFAILLPETDGDGAMQLAERLRQSIAANRIELGDNAATLKFTASIGIASLTGDADVNDLLATADNALYAAKAAGRNKVVMNRPA